MIQQKLPHLFAVTIACLGSFQGLFYKHGINSIPAWIGNHMSIKVWDEIIHLFPNIKSATIEVWDWWIISSHYL